jgi:hydroxymethylbilane synthase
MQTLRVASRRSALALTQTQWVIERLQEFHPGLQVEIVPVVTKGDKILDVTLSKVGGKGLFVTEIEQVLLQGEADFAVHSLKDVPAELAPGLALTAIPKREDPRDVLISRSGRRFAELAQHAVVGTSSLRRAAQLKACRKDLAIQSVRGNIDTRLRKLDEENLDAIVLAAAGLHRMGWGDRITEYLSPDVCLPAVGQGILGIESRADDDRVNSLLSALHDPLTATVAAAERTLLRELNGGCQVPIAGYAEVQGDGTVWLRGMVATPDGETVLRADAVSPDGVEAGRLVARKLRAMGADRILELTAASATKG